MSDRTVDGYLLSRSFEGERVAMLRRLVAKCAADAGLTEVRCQDAVLAVDEIVTNAVAHGGGSGHLELWTADGFLWFKITDWGTGLSAPPAWTPPSPTGIGGRGLWIARQISDRLTIDSGPSGTVVVGAFELPQA